MPPEVYNGPVWLEVLGGTLALIAFGLAVSFIARRVDRLLEHRFNAELDGDSRRELYRSASRLRVIDEVKPFGPADFDHAQEVLHGR